MDGHNVSRLFVQRRPDHAWHDSPFSLGESIFFKGCNIYQTRSVLRQRVFFRGTVRKDQASASREFKEVFVQRFFGLPRFGPTQGERGEIENRILRNERLSLGEILLEAVLAVEAAVALTIRNFVPVEFAIVDTHSDGVDLVWETTSPSLSRQAAEIACQGVVELLREQPATHGKPVSEFDALLSAFLEAAYQKRSINTTSLLLYAARQRGLPVKLLSREQLQIGHGCMQRLLESSMPDDTSAVAHRCCWDKRLALRRMAEVLLPVPKNAKAASVEAAHEAAERVGFPVVVKPLRASGGRGITSGIKTREGIEAAFLRAKRPEQDVLIEEYVPGLDYRLLVIGGKFAGGICRRPPTIIGDGRKTVQELIDDLNTDHLRDGIIMAKVTYDDEVETLLNEKGLTLQSVVAEGMACPLRLVANVAMGAVPEDCTDRVHQDNRRLAERAARSFFLDVAGIDFITSDISRSYREVGGRIIEVNTKPGLLIHRWPAHGQSRDFAAQILDRLYPLGNDGRIPVVVVAGDRGTGTTARLLDQLLRTCGKSTGFTLREAAYINGEAADLPPDKKRVTPTALLSNPDIEVLVSVISLRRVVQRGMELDSCSVAILLDRNKEDNAEQFQAGLSIVERATADAFIVGIGNQIALQHLETLGKRTLILVGDRITDPLAQQHLAHGGTVIADGRVNGEERIILMRGKRPIARFLAGEPPANLTKGQQRRMREVSRYAIAAAFAVGIPVPEIKDALDRSFGL